MDISPSTCDSVIFSMLVREVSKKKKASSARLYIATIKRLEEYCGSSEVVIDSVDSEFVSGFGRFLLQKGLKATSVKQMTMIFRALFRPFFGKDRLTLFEEAFGEIDSSVVKSVWAPGLEDFKRLVSENFGNSQYFEKIRDIFMLSFYDGGATFDEIRNGIDRMERAGLPQQVYIIKRFSHRHGVSAGKFLSNLTVHEFESALGSIGYLSGMKGRLGEESAVAGWKKVAMQCGISEETIMAVTGNGHVPGCLSQPGHMAVSEQDKSRAKKIVADAIVPLSPRWHVMRCYKESPKDTEAAIRAAGVLADFDFFETFAVPVSKGLSGKDIGMSLLGSTLFFNCTPEKAAEIKSALGKSVYVYSLPGTVVPAHVSESEMRTFMLLCDVGTDVIARHFPDYEIPAPENFIGKKARIVSGNFEGLLCDVVRRSDNEYKVFVNIKAFGNIKVSGNVPYAFLKFES